MLFIRPVFNLIAKVFSFGNRSDILDYNVWDIENVSHLEKTMKLWRIQRTICHFYNLIWFIWASLQNEKLFMNRKKYTICSR